MITHTIAYLVVLKLSVSMHNAETSAGELYIEEGAEDENSLCLCEWHFF